MRLIYYLRFVFDEKMILFSHSQSGFNCDTFDETYMVAND